MLHTLPIAAALILSSAPKRASRHRGPRGFDCRPQTEGTSSMGARHTVPAAAIIRGKAALSLQTEYGPRRRLALSQKAS